MRPMKLSRGEADLFRERLDNLIDLSHPLVRLAGIVPWPEFDEAFGKFFQAPVGASENTGNCHVRNHFPAFSDI